MFVKLALRNVQRQIQNYLIYFVTVAFSIALMFAVNNFSYSDRIQQLAEISSDMRTMFGMVTVLSCLVTALVLSYAASFMLRLRRREFGMYLTLGMTRRDIQKLFACETGFLSLLAMLAGMGCGLALFQFIVALFASIMEISFAISAYSVDGILLTLAVSIGLFLLSTLVSLRYLKKVTITELLKEAPVRKSEAHLAVWCILSVVASGGLIAGLFTTYKEMVAIFHGQEGFSLFAWLVLDLGMVFLAHFTLARSIPGILLRNRRLKNRGTNTVVLRGLSGKMTINAMLIGALSTLLVFAIVISNVTFGEKIRSQYSLDIDCPYDVMAMFRLSEEQGISMEEGRQIVESYSPIIAQADYRLYSLGETTLCSSIPGYEQMQWKDKFMPLSHFNALLADCDREPLSLEKEYLMVTTVRDIAAVDFSGKSVVLNNEVYSWGGNSVTYPDYTRDWFYFVIPDEAVTDMPVSDVCAAYTLDYNRFDSAALVQELIYFRETPDGLEERSDHRVREYYRLYTNATAGTLIIGTLYVATVFVCMALAILSIKILSTLDEERRRFVMLYCLGADVRTQKTALFRQIGAFFLMPFAFPLLMTVPLGLIFGEIYEIWGFTGLSGRRAMETSLLISLAMACVYVLYFCITYHTACGHVICDGKEQ